MSNPISEDCSSGLHEYCTPCECECHSKLQHELEQELTELHNTCDHYERELAVLRKKQTVEKEDVDPNTEGRDRAEIRKVFDEYWRRKGLPTD